MAGPSRKRKIEELKARPKKKPKKFKKQTDYDSGSGDDDDLLDPSQDFKAVNLAERDGDDDEAGENEGEKKEGDELVRRLEKARNESASGSGSEDGSEDDDDDDAREKDIQSDEFDIDAIASESETDASNSNSSDSEQDSSSETSKNPNLIKKKKRNDPSAFATSMSKILASKLSTSKRADPVLSRSVTAAEASREIVDQALEKKARTKMAAEKRVALEKGRVRDVIGSNTDAAAAVVDGGGGEGGVVETQEMERRLRKTAQRGVVKLFNAVRAAQVKGEEAAREGKVGGTVGMGRREERVNEMSKQGFLDLIKGGGGAGAIKVGGIEEA